MPKDTATKKSPNNLDLWNKVERTDPDRTKQFNRGGGFKGTAINATYLAKCATEQFGPIGIGWGVDVIEERYVEGHPLSNNNDVTTHATIHVVRVRLWHSGDREKYVEHFGQTTFVGKNKNGLFTDEEAPKKSLTDATNKCLSMLGFSADIFLGLFDDNKYVTELREDKKIETTQAANDKKSALKIEVDDQVQLIRAASKKGRKAVEAAREQALIVFTSAKKQDKALAQYLSSELQKALDATKGGVVGQQQAA